MRRPRRDVFGRLSFCTALAEHFGKECFWVHAMRGIMRTGVNAAWFLEVRAKIAGSCFLLDDRLLAAGILGIVSQDLKRMQIDIAVGTIARAEAAADAPILDDDLE